MVNLITGLVGIVGVVVFLGYYAIEVRSMPLLIIIVANLALAVIDLVQSVRKGDDR